MTEDLELIPCAEPGCYRTSRPGRNDFAPCSRPGCPNSVCPDHVALYNESYYCSMMCVGIARRASIPPALRHHPSVGAKEPRTLVHKPLASQPPPPTPIPISSPPSPTRIPLDYDQRVMEERARAAASYTPTSSSPFPSSDPHSPFFSYSTSSTSSTTAHVFPFPPQSYSTASTSSTTAHSFPFYPFRHSASRLPLPLHLLAYL